jgi:hypothetical protein
MLGCWIDIQRGEWKRRVGSCAFIGNSSTVTMLLTGTAEVERGVVREPEEARQEGGAGD